MNKKALIPLFLFLILLVNPINSVYGFSSYKINDTIDRHYTQFPDRVITRLSNGYYVVVYADSSYLYVRVIDQDGDLQAEKDIPLIYGGSYNAVEMIYSVGRYNDYVIIFVLNSRYSSKRRFEIIKYSYVYNNYTRIQLLDDENNYGYRGDTCNMTQVFEYNDKLYVIGEIDYYHDSSQYWQLVLMEYDPSSDSGSYYTLRDDSDRFSRNEIFAFQDQSNLNYIYIVKGLSSDEDTPQFWRVDLETKTLTYLCDASVSNYFVVSWEYFRFLGGEVEYTSEGKNVTYYWVFSDTDSVLLYRTRLEFNSSDVLIDQEKDGISYTLTVSNKRPILSGYVDDDYIYFWMIDEDSEGEKHVYKMTYSKGDSWDFVSREEDTELDGIILGTTVDYSHVYCKYDNIGALWFIYYDNSYAKVFTNLIPAIRSWSVTLSYLPNEDLQTNTQYLFTLTVYVNGYKSADTSVIIYLDNATIKSDKTNEDGQITFTVLTAISGYHEIKIAIYYRDVLDYTKTFNYFFKTSETGLTQTTIPTFMSSLLNLIPIFFLLLVPAIMLFPYLNIFGVILWLPIGSYICVASGLMPFSLFLLTLLVDSIFIIYMLKKGG